MDLVWRPDIKLRSRYVPWSRQVDLSDGLSLQPVLSHIFRNLGCRRQLLDGCEPLPVAPGAIIDPRQLYCHKVLELPCIRGAQAVSNTPMPRALAAVRWFLGGSSDQPKLLRRNVLPLAHPTAKARARSARYRLSCANREFCGGERSAPPRALQSRALQGNPSPRIKAGKMRRGHHSSLSYLVCHKAGYGHPQDDEGDLAVFLVAARRVKV